MNFELLNNLDDLSIRTILLNLTVALVLSLVLKYHFKRYCSSLSGKKEMARVFPFLVLIICLIISVVKSSLALSLGLVGALSIVRFRTPIKEPEELVYLFMAIAIGLGLGANQTLLTIVATLFILGAVALVKSRFGEPDTQNLYISLKWDTPDNQEDLTREISQMVADNSSVCDLKRLDQTGDSRQLSFLVDFSSADDPFQLVEEISAKHPGVSVTFIDHSRIPGI